MPKPKPAPKDSKPAETDVAAAIAAVVDAKRSYRAVAKDYGMNHVQLRRKVLAWRIANPGGDEPAVEDSEPEAASTAPSPWSGLTKTLTEAEPPERAPIPEADTSLPTDPITVMQGIIQEIQTQIRQNKLVGRVEVVSKLTTNLVMVSNNLARAIEKSSKADGAIVITKDEAISIEKDLLRRQKAEVGERPLLCSHCGRELSVLWGTGGNFGEPHT